jgi:hypothetical protein
MGWPQPGAQLALMLATGDCWFEEEDDDDEREYGNNRSAVADCWCIKEDDGDGV